jgi:hypothetical protein
MALISRAERNKLFLRVRHILGYPINPFELKDEMLATYLDMSIEDYSSYVNEWLIEQQWVSLEGLDTQSADFLNAFSTKENTYMRSFTYAYSRQVGQGTDLPDGKRWELQRDFITTSANTQVYTIPAGREVNEVLWETPPAIDQGLVDPFALSNFVSSNFGFNYLGRPAQYIQPTYSLLLSAQDRRMKERLLQSELTYRITAGPNGTKLLHLYPVPGGRNEIRDRFGKHFAGRMVWYFYYDVGDDERDKCLEENSDVVRLPSDPPVQTIRWDNLNSVAQQQIRDLLIAYAKESIGGIRGLYSGDIGVPGNTVSLDYRYLQEEGRDLREKTRTRIFEQLEKISQVELTRKRREIAENVNAERGFQPFLFPITTY